MKPPIRHAARFTARLAATGFAALLAPSAFADDSNWYRVELLVFAQGGPAAARQERWNPEPALAYPARARFLVYPQRVAQRLAEHPGASSEIERDGRQVISLPGPDPDTVEAPVAEDIPHREAETESTVTGDPTLTPAEPEPPALPEPFVARPAGELQFRGKAAYMEQHGDYRVLFHESWLQPMASEGGTRPIVLDDSGANRAYPELQGSVKLYAARYLHIDTNLWLNTAGDYLASDWQMPRPPLGPASVVIEEPVDPGRFGAPSPPPGSEPTGSGNNDHSGAGASEADAEAEPPYPYRHAVLLRQSRRMRSDEVHYIDHPMLGVVVKLTPLTEEQLQDIAIEEAERAEAAAAGGSVFKPGTPSR